MKIIILSTVLLAVCAHATSQSTKHHITNAQVKSDIFMEDAYKWLQTEDYSRAKIVATRAINLNKNNYPAYYIRGEAELFTQQGDSARMDFNEAIRLNPHFAEAYDKLGDLDINNTNKSIEDFSMAIKYTPPAQKRQLSSYYSSRADRRTDLLDWVGAIEDCNKAIYYSNDNFTAYTVRAQSEIEQGDYYNAIKDCDKAISIRPGFDSNPYYYRGVAELKIGNKQKACDDFYQAKKISGDRAYYKLNDAIRTNCQ